MDVSYHRLTVIGGALRPSPLLIHGHQLPPTILLILAEAAIRPAARCCAAQSTEARSQLAIAFKEIYSRYLNAIGATFIYC